MADPKYRHLAAVRISKADELQYYNTLQAILRDAQQDVLQELHLLMVSGRITDPVAVKMLLEALRDRSVPSEEEALRLASEFVESVNQMNLVRTTNMAVAANIIPKGISLAAIIQEENLLPILQASVFENSRLIKSLPSNMLDDVERIMLQATTDPSLFENMSVTDMIVEKLGVADRRAKLIAVDQSHKINAMLSRERQTALGVEGYQWLTAGDSRVRQKHKALNGRYFLWNPSENPPKAPNGKAFEQPPEFAPGMDIMCRCVPKGVIDLEKIMERSYGAPEL